MNKQEQRKFTAVFKVKVAQEALRVQFTIAKMTKSYDLPATRPLGGQILDLKKILSERLEELFTPQGEKIILSLPYSSVLYEQTALLNTSKAALLGKAGSTTATVDKASYITGRARK